MSDANRLTRLTIRRLIIVQFVCAKNEKVTELDDFFVPCSYTILISESNTDVWFDFPPETRRIIAVITAGILFRALLQIFPSHSNKTLIFTAIS